MSTIAPLLGSAFFSALFGTLDADGALRVLMLVMAAVAGGFGITCLWKRRTGPASGDARSR